MDPILIATVVSVALWFLMLAAVILLARYKRIYIFSVHSHEVRVEVRAGGVFLYVDGRLEEQVSGHNMRFSTLRATIDGEEFKAHVTARGVRTRIEATHGGREVPVVHAGK